LLLFGATALVISTKLGYVEPINTGTGDHLATGLPFRYFPGPLSLAIPP